MKTHIQKLSLVLSLLVGVNSLHASAIFTSLVSFTGTNGTNPGSLVGSGQHGGVMVQGNDGSFYGTTFGGGMGGPIDHFNVDYGTVFKMTPSGEFTSLFYLGTFFPYRLDGFHPAGNLIKGVDGNLYGTTRSPVGTAFQITTNGLLTTLYTFANSASSFDSNLGVATNYDGMEPWAGLVQGSDGNFYGTTASAGNYGNGTVFQLTPGGALTTLHAFSPASAFGVDADGHLPQGELVEGTDGNFYGTTSQGGSAAFGNGKGGTIYQITPGGMFTVLHTFTGGLDGNAPTCGLVHGADGGLFGTTSEGGAHGVGTAYRITTNGIFTTLHAFAGADGTGPNAALVEGSDGNFYGTTASASNAFGTVFQMSTSGTITTLHAFSGPDGANPNAQLVQAADGSLYGTTSKGGSGYGTIFHLTLPPVFRSITTTNGAAALTWSVMPGQTYQLQSTTNLGSTNWINLGSAVTATNATMSATDSTTNTQSFYRIHLLP